MTNELEVVNNQQTITSVEVAEMLESKHHKILEKLEGSKDGKTKGIIPVLTQHDFVVSDYFIESTYKDNSGKENKCYLFTKKGCEFIANKFTGERGIVFTAKYVERFNKMEDVISKQELIVSDIDRFILTIVKSSDPTERALALNEFKGEVEKPLLAIIEEQKPLADFAQTVNFSKTSITMDKYSNILNIKGFGRNTLFSWLRTEGYLRANNEPYRQYIEQGIFETKEKLKKNGDLYTLTLVTGKGQIYIYKKIMTYLGNVA